VAAGGVDRLQPLFCCFVGLGMDDVVWNHAAFSKDRARLVKKSMGG
jgi:hypothetical protein